MEYIDEISKVRLTFSKKVEDFYMNYKETYNFNVESGGIIVGCLNPADNEVIITDVTEPYPKDRRGSNFFKRSEYGHQQEMDRLWKESNYKKTYLGEWHTHNQSVPTPSFIDRKDWNRIGKLKLNYKQSFFVIVGMSKLRVWTSFDDNLHEMKEA